MRFQDSYILERSKKDECLLPGNSKIPTAIVIFMLQMSTITPPENGAYLWEMK